MKRRLMKGVVTALTTTAVLGSQVMGVAAAPAPEVSMVSKEALIDFYEENFDVETYKATYVDLVAAFGEDADDSVYLNHYLEHGMKEGRNAGGFDAIAFIINNYDYFAEHGLDNSFPFFDAKAYKATYPDLAAAFGDNLALYLNHYLNFGIFENRASGGELDIIAFAKANPNTTLSVNADLSVASTLKAVENQIKKASSVTSAPVVTATTSVSNAEVTAPKKVYMEGDIVLDEEEEALYDVDAYQAAKEAWLLKEPYRLAYLEGTGYMEAYNEWLALKPNVNDYLSEEGQNVYSEWLNSEPDYYEYLIQTGYVDVYEEWENAVPTLDDYLVGYTSQEAAEAALAEDIATWEANKPSPADYIDETSYEAAVAEYVSENPEPVVEDYPYFADGYTDADVAQAAYETAHNTWETGKPVAETEEELQAKIDAYVAENAEPAEADYIAKVNTYANAEEASAAYETALQEWQEAKPFQDEEVTPDGSELWTEWANAKPNQENYRYFEDGYASEEEATIAYNTAHNAWEAGKPVAETEEELQAKIDAYVAENAEPVVEDYTSKINEYESADAATEAFNAAHDAWEAGKPAKDDYKDDEAYQEALTEYVAENPEPVIEDEKYSLGNYATQEEAQIAYEADYEEHRNACPDETEYIDQTTFQNDYNEWVSSTPVLDDYAIEVDGKSYGEVFNEWKGTEPSEDEYLADTTYQEDYDAWQVDKPELEDFLVTSSSGECGSESD